MNYQPHYPAHPPSYMPFDYRTPPVSPGPGVSYYSTRYSSNTTTPSPGVSPKVAAHHRRASHAVPPPSYSAYQSARQPAPPQYAIPEYTIPRPYAPPRKPDYVSGGFDYSTRPRKRRESDAPSLKRKHRPAQAPHVKTHTKVFFGDGGYDYEYYYDSPPPPYAPFEPYGRHHPSTSADANYYYYAQVPIFEAAETKTSRPRRASHATKPQTAPPKRPSTAKTSPKATEEDARRAGIPAGYSYKNWDPTEEPIMLLGSVFDANSLGKWIYDWTVFSNGPGTPLAEMAGDLWLLLIQLAGKVKRAEETMPKIRKQEGREMVEDFLKSGERLWYRLAKLLKVCEDYMWKAAKKDTGDKKPVAMGKNSGCEFVNSIFGRDRELERTEKLMTGMRLWSMRFDANCEEYLRFPSA